MLSIFDTPNTDLALTLCSRDSLSSTAKKRAVNGAQLIATKSHGLFLKRALFSGRRHDQVAMRSSSGKMCPRARKSRSTSSPFQCWSPSAWRVSEISGRTPKPVDARTTL
jgi:hypothetical protein